ncbi:ATP-grasp domain-containing protein [Pseudalkalibacillus salsuginis]|uniref:carboxylate--amine ligase n=1 Tax=Pseudalkalibacillus salsuginis TaxID=2910972 RepID=UPI001F1DC1D6|nr:ATP-grasp domain-containing protein [Pseudalkalibacillus salsuginis]MCF6409243.1 ATP-grasp domain-containing protein [Pseudalkalibacillus salsuginis]
MEINKTIYYNAIELKQAIESNGLIKQQRPVLICNAHITGLAVARGLGREGIPVIALDREDRGLGFASKYVTLRGVCPNPVVAEKAFVQYLLDIGPAFKEKCILIPSMDEWVLTLAKYEDELSEFYIWPFSDFKTIEQILDKSQLYERAAELNVPVPKYEVIKESNCKTIIEELSFPMVLKPINKRAFYDEFQEGLFVVENQSEFNEKTDAAKQAGLDLIAQEFVNVSREGYVTVVAYMDGDQTVRGTIAGQRLEIYPPKAGTTCLVESIEAPGLTERAVAVLKAFSYEGIAECEFIFDEEDGEYKLLDINTRPWKWIGLPIACGVNLPHLLYSYNNGEPFSNLEPAIGRKWVYLNDYQKLKASHQGLFEGDVLTKEEWMEIILKRYDDSQLITTAVESLDDPDPAYQQIQNSFAKRSYYCPC